MKLFKEIWYFIIKKFRIYDFSVLARFVRKTLWHVLNLKIVKSKVKTKLGFNFLLTSDAHVGLPSLVYIVNLDPTLRGLKGYIVLCGR